VSYPPLPPNAPVPLPPPVLPVVSGNTGAAVVGIQKPPINARNKGQRGEREVIGLLQAQVNAIRYRYGLQQLTLQRNTLQAHQGGTDIHGVPGFAFEVKFQENQNVPAWWRQTLAQAERLGGVPVLFYRATRQPWTVMMRAYVNTPKDRDQIEIDVTITFDDFMSWFREAYDEACVDELQRHYH
jgi:hypothetical protein